MKTFKEIREAKKLTKKQNDLISAIKRVINIDIQNDVNIDFSNTKRIHLHTDDLSQNDINNLIRYGSQYKKFTVVPGGKNQIDLILK